MEGPKEKKEEASKKVYRLSSMNIRRFLFLHPFLVLLLLVHHFRFSYLKRLKLLP